MDEANEKIVTEAIAATWNFQFEEADKLLAPQVETDATFANFYMMSGWMRAVITESPDDVAMTFDRLRKAHHLASKLGKATGLPKGYDVLASKLVLAETDLFSAALKFKLEEYVKGIWKMRKAWKYYEAAGKYLSSLDQTHRLYKHYKSIIDAGTGFFHYIISIFPRTFKKLAENLAGFEGDRDRGLAELRSAAESGGWGSPLAMMHMTWINGFFLEDYAEGEKWLKQLLAAYPLSAHMHYMAGYLHRKHGKMDLADCAFLNALTFGQNVPQMVRYAEYDMGYNCFLYQEWSKCMESFTTFLSSTPAPPVAFRVYATFQLGVCLEMTGKHKEAVAKMKEIIPVARRGYDYDDFAVKYANKFARSKGISEFDKQFLLCRILDEGHQIDKCESALMDMIMKRLVNSKDEQAQHTWLRAVCMQKKGDLAGAKATFTVAMQNEKSLTDGKFVVPHSLAALGEIALDEKDYKTAEKHLKKAKAAVDYDFAQLLEWRCKRLLGRLAHEQKK
eukprot:TRINITY_DN16768_c0_g1_i1.p1 TRINITY_DN16768_c0_g1~~TRINITY_DN16768_c0_g1_i1.p1  ORF type:complete len:505 (-),score=161.82 TRINITY_DN16768_c0_g1_i1:71-1585(-)